MIMMRDLIDFCIFIVSKIAVLVVSVFVTTLVISFRGAGGSPSSVVRPPRASKRSGGSK